MRVDRPARLSPHTPPAEPPKRPPLWCPGGNADPDIPYVLLSKEGAEEILRSLGRGVQLGERRFTFIAAMASRLGWAGLARKHRRIHLYKLNNVRCIPPLPRHIVKDLELYHAPFAGWEVPWCH